MLKRKKLVAVIGAIVAAVAVGYAAFRLSPWPTVWLVRLLFARGGAEAADSIAELVPADVSVQRGLSYSSDSDEALLDVFAPASPPRPLPAVVWVHGGGFVAGSRSDLSNYLQILAARGYVTIGVDYSLAPGARFPTPIRQVNAALAYVVANATRFNLDPERVFLAGDSAGAQIAAQTALTLSSPSYAQQLGIQPGLTRASLRGLVLFCGPYDPPSLELDGQFAGLVRVVLWSYLGARDPQAAQIAQLAVTPRVTSNFPPAFISVGNADPLASQSVALAEALRAQGVETDRLFFAADHQPPLGHEYQLRLSTDAGRSGFERSIAFLSTHAK